jgi:hypothetical protein
MNTLTHLGHLPPISELFAKRTRHLIQRLHSLRIYDVETEARYEVLRSCLKHTVLLQPVTIGPPILRGLNESRKATFLRTFIHRMKGGFIRQISVPYTGSRELFCYSSDSSFAAPDTPIIIPSGKCLTVKLDAVFMTRVDAVQAAMLKLQPTMQLIERNNAAAIAWSEKTEGHIAYQLEKHHK